jgi:DNA adenine methylase
MSGNSSVISSATRPTPSRPPLRYYGSGWNRAAWTVSHFPAHEVYCEPCFGGGAVLLHKPPCKLEIANDLDGRVVTFFTVLRERPDDLARAIALTPWHEAEYRRCLDVAGNPLEDARCFFFASWASVKGGPVPGPSDFRWQKKLTRRSAAVQDVADLSHLLGTAERLKNVQFLNRDALSVIDKMRGTGALIYFDPPYLPETRSRRSGGYRHEPPAGWHEVAAELLRAHDGPVVVAGYRSDLYAVAYEQHGWRRVERRQRTNSGGSAVECLWLSPNCDSRPLYYTLRHAPLEEV